MDLEQNRGLREQYHTKKKAGGGYSLSGNTGKTGIHSCCTSASRKCGHCLEKDRVTSSCFHLQSVLPHACLHELGNCCKIPTAGCCMVTWTHENSAVPLNVSKKDIYGNFIHLVTCFFLLHTGDFAAYPQACKNAIGRCGCHGKMYSCWVSESKGTEDTKRY